LSYTETVYTDVVYALITIEVISDTLIDGDQLPNLSFRQLRATTGPINFQPVMLLELNLTVFM